jgi:hypothetical protein
MIGMPLARRLARASMLAALMALGPPHLAVAQGPYDPNACDAPGDSPNVIVGDLQEIKRHGTIGGITAFSLGTFSCNIGTCWLDWIDGNDENHHPTIGQNLFRVMNGRIEQLGQSWLKHGFYATSEELCETGCLTTDGDHLGVNCSDPYSATLNGSQNRLGPKFEVNATTGYHPHPVTDEAVTGDVIFKRLQVHNVDFDPALNPGARWFVEGQYVAEDDAAAGNKNDNESYREVEPYINNFGTLDLRFVAGADTQRMRPGILAWSDNDPGVEISIVDDPAGGRFYVGAKATQLGLGTWHYEYAIQNVDSDRSAGSVSVPVPAASTITGIGFHDVAYHSGEPFSGISWSSTDGSAGSVTWTTATFATNANANALRWGTLYNYRFDCDRPPGRNLLGIGLFKPAAGEADRLVVATIAPESCNGDGTCDAGETCFSCADCTDEGPDFDGDGSGYCADCAENDSLSWATPDEVLDVHATRAPGGEVILDWREPAEPGSSRPTYETLRTTVPSDFVGAASCLFSRDRSLRTVTDNGAPSFRQALYYLVRAKSGCAAGMGTTGTDSFGQSRLEAICQ